MKTLTHSQFQSLLESKLTGSTIISMRAETPQTSLNKGRGESAMIETIDITPDRIVKHTNIVGLINNSNTVSYQDFVNNRLLKEAKSNGKEKAQLTFEAGPRKWGTRIEKCPALLEHDGKKYMTLFCVTNNVPKVTHKYNGEVINLTEAKFDAYRKPEKKEGANQGTENPIIPRDYTLNNIKEVTMFKETFKLIPDA